MSRARWAAVGAAVAVSVGGGGLLTATAVTEPASAAVFVPTTPCRLADTRVASTIGPRSAPIEASSVLSVAVLGTNGGCTIPLDAAALVMNVTVVDMTESSFLTVYATDVARPTTANLNWSAGDAATANAVTASVSATGEIAFFNASGSTNLVADVVGYYTSAPLEDFYTKTEVDQLIAANPAGAGADGADGADDDSVIANLACATDQIVRFDGANWVCGDDRDTVGDLDCEANQSAGYDGTSWVCRSTPIVSTLSRLDSFDWCCTIDVLFDAYSPNVQSDGCDGGMCHISLVDVLDHTGCNVTYTGNSNQGLLRTDYFNSHLFIRDMDMLEPTEPLYVTISCVA